MNKFKNKILAVTLLATTFSASPLFAESLIDQAASPVSNPVNFEDPRIETNIKPIYAHHRINDKFVTGGGDVDVYAMQFRIAVTDDLAIIATKDGIVDLQPDGVLDDHTGLANLAAGVKYSLLKCDNSILTAGLRYEAPTGETNVLQGQGDGIANPFLSGAVALGPVNLIGYSGFRFRFDGADSNFFDASLHVDTKLGAFSPLFEVNLFHVLAAGNRLPIPDEGQDFFNIGSSTSDGETMVTGAAGGRLSLSDAVSFGAAYEFPMTSGPGSRITDWRITTDLIVTF